MIQYYIWLHEIKGITIEQKRNLLEMFGTPAGVFEADGIDIPKVMRIESLTGKESRKIGIEGAGIILKENEKHSIGTLIMGEDFPSLMLYYKGEIPVRRNPAVAIVGTRKATPYGIRAAEIICREYSSKGYSITSGLALGIDSVAHKEALSFGTTTYAFVASGLDICYPRQNKKLMESIAQSGAVFSTFPQGTPPLKHHFIQRNVIMSAWVDHVVVVEGDLSSGAVNTGGFGIKFGKTVFAVPGSIFSHTSRGCNQLIAEGAKPFILSDGSKEYVDKMASAIKLEPAEKQIIDLLKGYPQSLSEIEHKLSMGESDVRDAIISLELKGLIHFRPDGCYHYTGW